MCEFVGQMFCLKYFVFCFSKIYEYVFFDTGSTFEWIMTLGPGPFYMPIELLLYLH